MASALSAEQVSQFLSFIGLPTAYHRSYEANPARDLDFLTQLQTYTLAAIPYENLSLHYSPAHTVSLEPQTLFQKIVVNNRGRGGYCMENSLLLNHVLRALRFPVYTSAVRIRRRKDGVPFGDYTGWVHIVNLLTLSDGSKYMMDVGFGGDGATRPVPLLHDQPQPNLGAQEIRLIHGHIPYQTVRTPETRLWIYEYRNGPDRAWNSFYAFPEAEAFEADFRVVNWFTGNSPVSPQLESVLVIKFLRRPGGLAEGDAAEVEGEEQINGKGEGGRQVIYGKRMLVDGVVKENLGGRTKVIQTCVSEAERVAAIKGWFGIDLTPEEKGAIVGWRTELKS